MKRAEKRMKKAKRRTFIYPESRRYPVEAVCAQIVRALQEHNFSLPGYKVLTLRPSWNNLEYVTRIQGPDFEIEFEHRDSLSEIAVSRIRIPGSTLWLTAESQNIFLQICADDPDVSQCRKNHGNKGLCTYRGSEGGNYVKPTEPGLPIYLIATEDSHWMKHGCPSNFLTKEVFSQFTHWLERHVLEDIDNTISAEFDQLIADSINGFFGLDYEPYFDDEL